MTAPARILYVAVGDGDERAAAALGEVGTVLRAERAVDALKRLEDESVDCLVAPIPTPGMAVDGFVDMIREQDASVPIVVAGEPDDPEVLARALADEHTDYVSRVDDPAAVVPHVRRAISRLETDVALDRHERLRRLFRDITRAVTAATDRSGVEQAVYDRLATTDLYRFVWIGEYDADANEMLLHVPFDGRFDPTEIDSLVDGGEPAALRRALDTGAVTVNRGTMQTRGATTVTPSGTGRGSIDPAADEEFANAVVPLVYRETSYGLLLLATDRPHAFDEAERALLDEIADVVAHALWALENEGSASEADAELAEFAALLAHELRNPIGIAETYLEIARKEEDPEALDRIETALDGARETIESVLSVIGRSDVDETTSRDLATDAREAWSSLDAGDAQLEIADARLVDADHNLVVRLFTNLFRNAIGHAGDDASVEVGLLEDGFYVEDDGPGIPPEDRDAVFEWGYSTTEGGIGIGLSIVRKIADAHGWEISATDAESGGARFEIRGVDP